MTDTDPLLTGPEAAARVGIKAATWRSYVHKGYIPEADDPDKGTSPNRRNPRWRASTVDAYKMARPGRGARTDRLKPADTRCPLPPEPASPVTEVPPSQPRAQNGR